MAALSLLMACGKENTPKEEAPNLSPDGKQWIIESSGSPDMTIGFIDLSLGNGKAVYYPSGVQLSTLKKCSDFYFYTNDLCSSYQCTTVDGDDNIYSIVCGIFGFKYTALSEDTGFGTFESGPDNIHDYIFRTTDKYLNRTLLAVNQSLYETVSVSYTGGSNGTCSIITNEDGVIGFSKLTASNYGVVVIEGEGANADYSGKNVNGKLVFVSDGGSLSLKEKSAIALANGAAAIIIYHPSDSDGVECPYKKTFDSIPSGESIPIGIFYESAEALNYILNATTVKF